MASSYQPKYLSGAVELDLESMPRPTIYNRALEKAAARVGGERALARFLNVSLVDLYVWMHPGAARPPRTVFLKAVDLLLNDLDDSDQQRAQKVRVAVIHEERRRAQVMQTLKDLLPDDEHS